MKDEPQPQPQTETPAEVPQASIFGRVYWSTMAVIWGMMASLWFQEPIVGVVQGDSVGRVEEMAKKAGRAAEAQCAKPGTGAETYEIIRDLAEPKLVFNTAAYTPSGLADVLERLEANKVTVRAPFEAEAGTSAIFRKGADGNGDVLELDVMSKHDELMPVFMERVIEDGPGMKPGTMMILHHDWNDGMQSVIVHAPAGAEEYQAVWPDNPFPTGKVNRIPAAQCRLD
jgi:hypothetical protein